MSLLITAGRMTLSLSFFGVVPKRLLKTLVRFVRAGECSLSLYIFENFASETDGDPILVGLLSASSISQSDSAFISTS